MATRIQCSAPSLNVTRFRQSRGVREHFIEILLTICYAIEALSVDLQIFHDYQITEGGGELYNALKYYLTILFLPSREAIFQFSSQGQLGVVDSRFRQCLVLVVDYMAMFSDALDRKILQQQTQGKLSTVGFDLVVGSWVTVRHPREILLFHVWDRLHKNRLRSKGDVLEERDLRAYLGRCTRRLRLQLRCEPPTTACG